MIIMTTRSPSSAAIMQAVDGSRHENHDDKNIAVLPIRHFTVKLSGKDVLPHVASARVRLR